MDRFEAGSLMTHFRNALFVGALTILSLPLLAAAAAPCRP